MSEKPKKRKGLKANYQGATPEEVALAVLRYRPGKKKQQEQERVRVQNQCLPPPTRKEE